MNNEDILDMLEEVDPQEDGGFSNVNDGEYAKPDKKDPIDPGYGVDTAPSSDELEDFMNQETMYAEIGSIAKVEDFKLPQELKSNYRMGMGCPDSNKIIEAMMNNVSGHKIIGNYFNLRTDRHDATVAIASDMSGAAQSYNLIKNAIIFSSSPLDSHNLKEASIEGIIAFGIVPRLNDYFAMVGKDNALRFFKLSELSRVTYGSREIHKATFTYAFSEITSPDKIQDLLDKVVDTYVFNYDAYLRDESGLLLEEDEANRDELLTDIAAMKEWYFLQFKSYSDGCINMFSRMHWVNEYTIDTNNFLYDIMVSEFFKSMINFSDNVRDFGYYTPKYKLNLDVMDIYKALRFNGKLKPSDLYSHIGPDNIVSRHDDPYLNNILYFKTLEKQIVQPHIPTDTYVDYPCLQAIMGRHREDVAMKYPLLGKELTDKSYVFSKHFYNDDKDKMNGFEKIVADALEKRYPNYKDIKPYIDSYRKWSLYEAYYCLPILLYICIKVSKGYVSK